jgi:3',5'-cyclic AMP phosphodiesterase CpdA
MIIAQISDTHIMAGPAEDEAGARRAENLRRCIVDINRQGVDVVIHTGDSVHNGLAAEYANLRGILAGLEAPLFLVPGNRDRRDALRAAFDDYDYLPATGDLLHYAIDDYPVRLVALDSIAAGERKGVFDAARLAWLDETLARAPEKPTVMFMHHPPFDIGDHYVGGYRRPEDAEELEAVVRRHPQVRRLLCGHVHCAHRTPWGGTVATTMPSVAVDLRKEVDPAFDGMPVYLLHRAAADGRVESRMRVAAG